MAKELNKLSESASASVIPGMIGTKQSCTCETCQSMCKRPCWGTPEEIFDIMIAGHGDRLMLDYWVDSFNGDIKIVCPASKGCESFGAPYVVDKPCTFQDASSGLCALHSTGLKPVEGREVWCGIDPESAQALHEQVAKLWDTEEGRAVVELWKESIASLSDRVSPRVLVSERGTQ